MEPGEASPDLSRLAWWAWLRTPDDAIAERLTEYHHGLPPWLDPWPWLALGLAPGVALGVLVALLCRGLGLRAEEAVAVGLVVALTLAGSLAVRDPLRERAGEFPYRVATALLHLPYVVVAAIAYLLFLRRMVGPQGAAGPAHALWFAVGAAPVILSAARASGPRVLTDPSDGVWPSLGGLPSFGLRVSLLTGAAVLLALAHPPSRQLAVAAAVLLGSLASLSLQERVARRMGRWLTKRLRPARSRRWPSWLPPAPFAFEAALLAADEAPAARELAARYCDACDYPATALDAALRQLSRRDGRTPDRLLAAAVCALELWRSPDSNAQARYRAFARLDGLVAGHGRELGERFERWLEELLPGSPRAAEILTFMLTRRDALGQPPARARKWLWKLDWAGAAAAADEASRRALVAAIVELHGEEPEPASIDRLLCELDRLSERLGIPEEVPPAAEVRSLVERVLGEAAGERLPNHHPCYVLELRRRAWRVVADHGAPAAVQAWYDAAKRYEELPAVRQEELLPAFSYRRLWDQVLTVVADPEEERRQDERYRLARARRGSRSEGETSRR